MKDLSVSGLPRVVVLRIGLALVSAILLLAALLSGLFQSNRIMADQSILYVDGASGQDTTTCGATTSPCRTISHTINNQANDSDIILIVGGRYTENLTITGIDVTLRGGYQISGTVWISDSNETVINGGSADRTVFIHNSNSSLENLTLVGGAADASACWGDAVWITDGSVTIRSSTIKDNSGDCIGIEVNHDFGPGHLTLESSTIQNMRNSAIHVWGEFASAEIDDVTFLNNKATSIFGVVDIDFGSSAKISNSRFISNTSNSIGGGVAVKDGASAVIENSQFFSNTALGEGGGGAAVVQASLRISESAFVGNSAPSQQSGGIHVASDSTVSIVDSQIRGNTASLHGAAASIAPRATLHITNTLLAENSTASGTANVFAISGDVTMINSTMSQNNPQGAQAVLVWSGHFTGVNNILWNNALNLQADPPCSDCFTVTYTDIEGGWPGIGNQNADPQFVGTGDFRLAASSPAIDAGANDVSPGHDLDRKLRPQDGNGDGIAIADMGAYEFQPVGQDIFLPLVTR